MISSNPNDLPKTPPPNTVTLGVRVSRYEFGGMQTFSPYQKPFSELCEVDDDDDVVI